MLTLNVKIVKLSRMLSLPGWVYQKKFAFTKTWGYNINSSMFCVNLTFEWHEMPCYSLCSFFFFFFFESALGKDASMKAASVTVMVIFSKVPF